MRNAIYIVGLALLLATTHGFGQDAMTPARFREIVNSPGDAVPLVSQLAAVLFWTNAVVSNVMTYASGKVFREEMAQTARTVSGRYVVCTFQSQFYKQPMNAILMFDEKTATLKTYGLYSDGQGSDGLTEGRVVYNFAKKTYTLTSSYGDGFKEKTAGSYTDAEDHARTEVYRNGALFMSRELVTRPVISKK